MQHFPVDKRYAVHDDVTVNVMLVRMIKAIFETFFTRFDIEKFNSLYNEWAHLEEIQDFSQRYQTLKDIFISPNYKNEFYHFDPSDDVLDLFAEKVASKIMKKLEKGS